MPSVKNDSNEQTNSTTGTNTTTFNPYVTNKEQDDRLISSGSILPETSNQLDMILRTRGYVPPQAAIGANYFGMNHQQLGIPISGNRDNVGFVFFTRPRIRLSYDNLSQDRKFLLLNTNNEFSPYRVVRAYLDPVGCFNKRGSKLVDSHNAFIPLLSNNLKTLSGWPEHNIDFWTSKEGARGEQRNLVDSYPYNYKSYSLSATFKNQPGNPIVKLFQYWTQYAQMAKTGYMTPHLDSILDNEIDYETRIYRFIMDKNREYITDVCCCLAAVPGTDPSISQFDYNSEHVYNQADTDDEVSINFQCTGTMVSDPIILRMFNDTVSMFNIAMSDKYRKQQMQLVSNSELRLFNFMGYPLADLKTGRLHWYVRKTDYAFIKSGVKPWL